MHLVHGDVQRRAFDVAGREAGTRQVDDHLALRGYGRGDKTRLVGRVLQGRGVLEEGVGMVVHLGGGTAEHTAGGHVLHGGHLGRHAIHLADLLKGIVGHESA